MCPTFSTFDEGEDVFLNLGLILGMLELFDELLPITFLIISECP